MSTPFIGNPADLKTRRVAVLDLHPDRVRVRLWPKTDDEVEFSVQLTPRQLAVFRLAVRYILRSDRRFPDGIRDEVLDVPAPQNLPDPAAIRTCTRLVASLDPYGLMLLSLLESASVLSARFVRDEGRGWCTIGSEVFPSPRSVLAKSGRAQLVDRIGRMRAQALGVAA